MPADPRMIRAQRFPLHHAVESRNVGRIQQLLDSDIRSQINRKFESSGQTVLHIAAASGTVEIVNLLIQAGANLEEIDSVRQTALHYSATNRQERIMETLIMAGCDVNPRRLKDGWTPLFITSIFGYTAKVKCLTENGADVLLADDLGWTPEDWAAKYNLHLIQNILRQAPRMITEFSGRKYVELVKEDRLEVPVEYDEGISRLMAKIEIKRRAKIEAEKLKKKLKQEIENQSLTDDVMNGNSSENTEEESSPPLEDGIHCHGLKQDYECDQQLEEATTNILERQKRLVTDEIVPNTATQEENAEENVSKNTNVPVILLKDFNLATANNYIDNTEIPPVDDKIISAEWSPVNDLSSKIDFTCTTEIKSICDSKTKAFSDDMKIDALIDECNLNVSKVPSVDISDYGIVNEKSSKGNEICPTNQISIIENEELDVPNCSHSKIDEWSIHIQDHDNNWQESTSYDDQRQKNDNFEHIQLYNIESIKHPLEIYSKEGYIEDENKNEVQDLTIKVKEFSLQDVPEDTTEYEVIGNTRTDVIENNVNLDTKESQDSVNENNNKETLLGDQEVQHKLNKSKEVIENLFAFSQKVPQTNHLPEDSNELVENGDNKTTTYFLETAQCDNNPESIAISCIEDNNNNIEDDKNKNIPNLEALVTTSELPETVEDPEFDNKIRVFTNYRNFGGMYNRKANYRKAEWAFKNAIKQATGHKPCSREQLRMILEVEIEFRINRARCLFQMGQLEDAREECQSVLGLDCHNQDVRDIIQTIN